MPKNPIKQPKNAQEQTSVPNPFVYPTRADDIAKVLDLSARGFTAIKNKLNMPREATFEDYVCAYIRHLRQAAMRGDSADKSPEGSELAREKLRQAKEQADKLELDNQRKRAELLPTDEVAALWNQILANFRSRILELPNKITPLLQASQSFAEAESILKSSVTEALQELAQFDIERFAKTGYEEKD